MGEKKSRDEGKTKFIRIKPNRFDKMFFSNFFSLFSVLFSDHNRISKEQSAIKLRVLIPNPQQAFTGQGLIVSQLLRSGGQSECFSSGSRVMGFFNAEKSDTAECH